MNLDLVEIQPQSDPPVVKIINYEKLQFSINKKKLLEKKKKKEVKIKEVKFRPTTGLNDYLVKIKNIKNFLDNGNKTRITICFKGREITHKENGLKLMQKICNDLKDYSRIESDPKFEGKSITVVMCPKKK